MQKNAKSLTIFVCIVAFVVCMVLAPAQGMAQGRQDGGGVSTPAVVGDLLVVRPLGIVSVAAGSVIFVATLPFSVWGGKRDIGTVSRKLVVEPAIYTFKRPVGDFQEGYEHGYDD